MRDNGMKTDTGAFKPTPLEMSFIHHARRDPRRSRARARERPARALPASVYGLCHYLLVPTNAEAATWFPMCVSDGDRIASSDPITQLRSRITRLRVWGGHINEVSRQ